MGDVFSKAKRSELMSKIRSKNTKLEVNFRKKVFAKGLRYRIYPKNIPGKPDMVFPKSKLAVFIDGCFWHKCPKCFKEPVSNKDYWIKKIQYNVDKDKRINQEIENMGWRVLRFWEHEIKKNPEKCIKQIESFCN
ncbi:MAG: very short patch repair endonuclease [Nanoarchaeota archaeon]